MHGKHCKSYIGVFLKIEDCEAAAGGGVGGGVVLYSGKYGIL